MLTRRSVVRHTLQAAAVASAYPLSSFAQHPQQPPTARPDDMTVNSAQQQQHFPPPDFGPVPAALPSEALAVSGRHSLRHHARQHGLLAGAAVIVPTLKGDPALASLIGRQYDILVPENELKWHSLRPTQDFNFQAADGLFSFASARGMLVRGHTLAWHNSVPDWIRAVPMADVRQLFTEHITTVVSRYRGRVHSWDVVNEAIFPEDELPGSMRKSFWYQAVGTDYIDLAFRTARQADPHAKLTYNDYGVETDSAGDTQRREAVLALLQGMKDRGVPLDAVGIQAHIHAASSNRFGQGLADFIAAIAAMGLEVYITEMDVNEDDVTADDIASRDAAVAAAYRDFLHVALAHPSVKLLLTWGVSDRRTWLNDGPTHHRKQPNRPQRSLPFDPEYRPAPAFFAIRDSIDARRFPSRETRPAGKQSL